MKHHKIQFFAPLRLCVKIIILNLTLILTISFTGISQNKTCWPSFRGNQALTGYTNIQLPKSFKLLWSFKAGSAIKSSPVICGENIYIGSNDGYLYSITKEGKLNWKYNCETSVEASPLYLNGIIYVGSLEGNLYAIDSKSGKLKWKYITEGQISGPSSWVYTPDKRKNRL